MRGDRASSCSSRASSPLSFPPSLSSPLASIASSTARSSKSGLKSIKNVVKKAIHPFKKARTMSTSSNASIVGDEEANEGADSDEESDGTELSMYLLTG